MNDVADSVAELLLLLLLPPPAVVAALPLAAVVAEVDDDEPAVVAEVLVPELPHAETAKPATASSAAAVVRFDVRRKCVNPLAIEPVTGS